MIVVVTNWWKRAERRSRNGKEAPACWAGHDVVRWQEVGAKLTQMLDDKILFGEGSEAGSRDLVRQEQIIADEHPRHVSQRGGTQPMNIGQAEISNAGYQWALAADQATAAILDVQAEMLRPSTVHKPRLYQDGDQWCALLGDDIMSGLSGFGDTPAAAFAAFDKAFTTPIHPEQANP